LWNVSIVEQTLPASSAWTVSRTATTKATASSSKRLEADVVIAETPKPGNKKDFAPNTPARSKKSVSYRNNQNLAIIFSWSSFTFIRGTKSMAPLKKKSFSQLCYLF
jgi:hypothetical protein